MWTMNFGERYSLRQATETKVETGDFVRFKDTDKQRKQQRDNLNSGRLCSLLT